MVRHTFSPHIFIGFDGFIDTIFTCIDIRTDHNFFSSIHSLSDFSQRVQKSTNIECVRTEQSLGGNAPLLAQTLLSLNCPVELVAHCGFPNVHPLFAPLVPSHSFGNPGKTDALEFSDGKILLGKMEEIETTNLHDLLSRVPNLPSLISHSAIIATLNWTMMPLVEQFWEWLLSHHYLLNKETYLFVDFADPRKRAPTDLADACTLLSKLNCHCRVILSLNQEESKQIATACSIPHTSLLQMSQNIQSHLSLNSVIIHTPHQVAGYTDHFHRLLPVSHCDTISRTTGAGDNFNAGVLFALYKEKKFSEALELGIKTAEIWVKTGKPATLESISS